LTGKLDASQAESRRRAGEASQASDTLAPDSARGRKMNIDVLTAEFQDEVNAMESQMADIGKSLQMSRFGADGSASEAKRQEEREAEKRRREAELRKARLQEKNARDPHKKIQLRLENKRRFEMDTLDDAGIPTTDFIFQSSKGNGSEKLRVVDVQALRSKCQGLTEGIHSVSKLVELRQRRDQASRLAMSSSMPSLGFAQASLKDRMRQAQG